MNPLNYIKNLFKRKTKGPDTPDYDTVTMYFMIELENGDEIAMRTVMRGLHAKNKDAPGIAIDATKAQLQAAGLTIRKIRPASFEEFNRTEKDAEEEGRSASFQIY